MIIHVVQEGESLDSISEIYGIPKQLLISDNGLTNTSQLVIGQSLVVLSPEQIYIIKESDTLEDIANYFQVTVMQLYRNNFYLAERQYVYPGDALVISYKKRGYITVHGNSNPNINLSILRRTLPYLTYLSIVNYTTTKQGEIVTYYDDSEIIQISRNYGVMPLMLVTTLTLRGEANIGTEYDLILNRQFQENYINNVLRIIRSKGYYGVNISFQYVNISNVAFYNQFLEFIAARITGEGFTIFVTINPNLRIIDDQVRFEAVDYASMNLYVQNMIFMNFDWPNNIEPPAPIASLYNIENFMKYLSDNMPLDKVIIGVPTIGYDWELPFLPGFTNVYSLSPQNVIELAREQNAVILFDEVSKTPYFQYTIYNIQHIVWFIDARSVSALTDVMDKYNLQGSGIWNIAIFNSQLWSIINSQYDITKIQI